MTHNLMKVHFETFAAYNRWANCRLYDAAATLTDTQYREPRGTFFGSMHGTLNHILVGDRMWLSRLTGEGPTPSRLNEILCEDLPGLRAAREAEDARIIAMVSGFGDADWEGEFRYVTATSGQERRSIVHEALAHFFNHQTHHRGQAHAILTGFGHRELELDLIYYIRSRG